MLPPWLLYLSLISTLVTAQLDRAGWTVTADSSQAENPAANILDGNADTIWHTQFNPTVAPLPHNVVIDMKNLYNVNAISIQPRQDGNSNGNIGEHRIELSTNGANWGTPLAIGTYVDTAATHKTFILITSARYIRITALTEAGGRGAWTSIAEVQVFAAASGPPAPNGVGQWSPTIDFPIVPAAGAIEHDTGKMVVWSSNKADTFGGAVNGLTYTSTYDPTTATVSQRIVTNTEHDMFCPGLSLDFNGRAIVTGGDAAQKTTIYDPAADNWIAGPNMVISRGYQAQATLSDGRTFVIGGSWSGGIGGKNGEIYNPASNSWSLLSGCPVAPMLTNDAQGVYRQDNHGWLFGWKGGSVFQAGPSKAMNWYGTTGAGSVTGAGTRGTDPDSMCGNAVMYDAVAGKILTVGGSPNYQSSTSTANAHIITIGNPGTAPLVTAIGSMKFNRAFHNSVVLPDGKVFVTGGQGFALPFSDDTSALYPELWDPATSTFTTCNPIAVPRNYHSIALLMPDATVFNGGGGLCGGCTTNHFDGQVFSPPYLFTGTARPVITAISVTSVKVGGTITVTTNGPITAISLIRLGSTTHTVNTDQRRIPFNVAGGGPYTITVPADPGVALPGYYFVFCLNSAGVPSIAKTLLIGLT